MPVVFFKLHYFKTKSAELFVTERSPFRLFSTGNVSRRWPEPNSGCKRRNRWSVTQARHCYFSSPLQGHSEAAAAVYRLQSSFRFWRSPVEAKGLSICFFFFNFSCFFYFRSPLAKSHCRSVEVFRLRRGSKSLLDWEKIWSKLKVCL